MEPEQLYGHAALWAWELIGMVDGEAGRAPTPCPGWTAADVAMHLVEGNLRTAAAVRQRPEEAAPAEEGAAGAARATDALPAALQERYRRSAAEVMTAFRECMALSQHVEVDGRTLDGEALYVIAAAEQLVHGWDLARALDAGAAPDAELVEAARTQLQPVAADLAARGDLAPPVAVPRDADPLDQVAAMFGRTP